MLLGSVGLVMTFMEYTCTNMRLIFALAADMHCT